MNQNIGHVDQYGIIDNTVHINNPLYNSEDVYLCILTVKLIGIIFQMYRRFIKLTEFLIVFQSINIIFVLRNNYACLYLIHIKQQMYL